MNRHRFRTFVASAIATIGAAGIASEYSVPVSIASLTAVVTAMAIMPKDA